MTTSAIATKRWYVYLLCDPDTEQPFYVGKGTRDRMYSHERLKTGDQHNKEKRQIIQDIIERGKQVLVKKIAEFDDEHDAYVYEFSLICLYAQSLSNMVYTGKNHVKKEIPDGFIDPQCAADLLHISRVTLDRHAKMRGIQKYKRGLSNHTFYKCEDIDILKDWLFQIKPDN